MEIPKAYRLRQIWFKLFHEEKDCKYYFNGLCLKKMNNGIIQSSLKNSVFECEICENFEKYKIDKRIKRTIVRREKKS